MSARLGTIELINDQLVFDVDADVDHYNRLLDRLDAIADEETAIQQRIKQELDKSKSRLEAINVR